MSNQITRKVVRTFQQRGRSRRDEENITRREKEILTLLTKGYRTKEMADVLNISTLTVQTHLRNVYEKLRVRSRSEAVARCLGNG